MAQITTRHAQGGWRACHDLRYNFEGLSAILCASPKALYVGLALRCLLHTSDVGMPALVVYRSVSPTHGGCTWRLRRVYIVAGDTSNGHHAKSCETDGRNLKRGRVARFIALSSRDGGCKASG